MQGKLLNRYFILIWFSMLCLMLIQNLMCSGIPLFFASRGFSTSFADLLGLPFALFGILARATGDYLMDRFDHRVIAVLDPLLTGIASLLFLLLPLAPLMLLFRGLHGAGFSIGQVGSSTATIDVTLQEKSSLEADIFRVSTALVITVAGWLIEILGSGGTYDRIFYFSFAFGVLSATLAFLCRYEEGRPPVVREPQEVNLLHGLRKFLYPAATHPVVIEFFVMLRMSYCGIFIFTYIVLQGCANPNFFMVVAILSMIISNPASGRLLRTLGHRTLLSITMVLSGALIALIALVPCQATFCLGGISFGMAQGFSFPILTLLAVDNVPQNHCGTANSTVLMTGGLRVGLGTLLWGIFIQLCGFHVFVALSGLAVVLNGVLSLLFYCHCKP